MIKLILVILFILDILVILLSLVILVILLIIVILMSLGILVILYIPLILLLLVVPGILVILVIIFSFLFVIKGLPLGRIFYCKIPLVFRNGPISNHRACPILRWD